MSAGERIPIDHRMRKHGYLRQRFVVFLAFVLAASLVLLTSSEPVGAGTPSNPFPGNGATDVPVDARLSVDVSAVTGTATATFYGREAGTGKVGVGEDFTVVALPDTQKYSSSSKNYVNFIAQADWILDERVSRNIVLVDHLGDIVNSGSSPEEWDRAAQALLLLNQNDIAVGIAPGNHDYHVGSFGDATLYDQHLPATSAIALADGLGIVSYDVHDWYGSYQGGVDGSVTGSYTDRRWKNNYVLFSAGGMDFINIAAEYNIPADTPAWMDAVLDAYPDRRAIISTHQWLEQDGSVSTNGQIQEVLSNILGEHCNVFLIVSGHNHSGTGDSDGEAAHTETNACGDDVHMRLSDYQDLPNGGNGWLRIMTFHPTTDTIDVETYSPVLDDYMTDFDSKFTLDYDMDSAPSAWPEIGSVSGISSGGSADIVWSGLSPETEYEWYVEISDGAGHSDSETWSFTTGIDDGPPTPPDAGTFSDDDGSVFEADIEWLAGKGITKGCNPPGNTKYCPDGSVTRGETSAFLHRALVGELDVDLSKAIDFTDTDTSVFEGDIAWLSAAGITRSCNPLSGRDMYCPMADVTRGQMAAFLHRAFSGLIPAPPATSPLFTDSQTSIFKADIQWLADASITKGCNPPTNTNFCPNDHVSRGEMAAFIHRAFAAAGL